MRTQLSLIRAAGLALVGLVFSLATSSGADWGSIRANNRERSEHAEHARAPVRPVPPPVGRGEVREHHEEPVRTPPARELNREAAREHEHREALARRHDDIEIDRRHGYYWSGYHSGMRIVGLPGGYLSLSLGGRPYYYYEGVYFQPGPTGYVVVNPPVGAIVPELPPGAETVVVSGTVYYYAGGAFYFAQPNGYAVVPPPLGVTVTTLPPGAVPVVINGNTYYSVDSVYYLPVMENGIIVYMTVRP